SVIESGSWSFHTCTAPEVSGIGRSASAVAGAASDAAAASARQARRTARSERRLVLAVHVLHRAAHLSHRAPVLQGLSQDGQQVVGAARCVSDLREPGLHDGGVAVGLERLQSLELLALGLWIDSENVWNLGRVLDELVDADDDVLSRPVALVVAERGLLDLALDEVD